MASRIRTVSWEINNYLRSPEFVGQVLEAYRRFDVLAEGALRTLVVNLLKEKLKTVANPAAKTYHVTCEDFLPGVRKKPDVLIWKDKHPRFWIELKDTRVFVKAAAERDWAKLKDNCRKFKTIKGGYMIYVARNGKAKLQLKRDRETLFLWPIGIKLEDEMGEAFEKWNKEYKSRAQYQPKARAAKA